MHVECATASRSNVDSFRRPGVIHKTDNTPLSCPTCVLYNATHYIKIHVKCIKAVAHVTVLR